MSAEERPSAISGQHRGSRGKPIGVLIGGGIGALAAYAGMRLGDAYGSLLPLGAGVVGAVLGGGVSAALTGNADSRMPRHRDFE